MTDATAIETDPEKLVGEARGWALSLWDKAHKGIGGTQDQAMHKAASMAGVTPHTLWKLRYRTPEEIGVSIYNRLKAAHARHIESVEARLADDLAALRLLPPTPHRARLVAQVEDFLGTAAGPEGPAAEDDDQSLNWG